MVWITAAAWLQETANALQGEAGGGAGILGRKGIGGAAGAQSVGAALADGALSVRLCFVLKVCVRQSAGRRMSTTQTSCY